MNIFSILSESRNPSTNTGKQYSDLVHNRQMRIVVEAEEDEKEETPEPEAEDNDTADEKENESKEEDTKEDDKEDTEEETPNEPEEGEDEIDAPDLGDESGESDDMGSDDSSSGSSMSTEEIPKDDIDPDKTKAHALLDDAITLYYSIKRIIDKLDTVSGDNVEILQSFIHAKNNFISLSDLLFDFITQRFTTNTYVKNLYIFNYFIQTYKLNVDILEKTIKSQSE